MGEIEQLREEIAKLRERVAVLEAQPKQGGVYGPIVYDPYPNPPYKVTC